jgi:hypothetical protein
MSRRVAWSNTAPFGTPVVPLVQTMATGSDGSRSGSGDGGSSSYSAASSDRGSADATPAGGSMPSSTTTTFGVVRSTMLATSAGPSRRLIPVVIAPSRMAAA